MQPVAEENSVLGCHAEWCQAAWTVLQLCLPFSQNSYPQLKLPGQCHPAQCPLSWAWPASEHCDAKISSGAHRLSCVPPC